MMDWDQLYRQHYDGVFRMLYRRTSGNRELSRDLTQDTFVRAMRAERQFTDDGRGMGPWLTVIAGNLLRDHWKARSNCETPVEEFTAWDQPVAAADLVALDEMAARQLLGAVSRLPEWQREAVVLSYWGGMSDAQIGARVGANARTVNVRRFRARQTLRHQLAGVA